MYFYHFSFILVTMRPNTLTKLQSKKLIKTNLFTRKAH